MPPHVDPPLDPGAAERLAARGLRLAVVDPGDEAALRRYFGVVARAFLKPEPTDEEWAEAAPDFAEYRSVAVYEAADDPATAPPVGTIVGWRSEVTVPGGSVPAWAVSDVSVAPTHRRSGIGRVLLEADLRTAAAAGLPLAMLTVSEATIYARYGYGPAAQVAELSVDTRRARWIGPEVSGRLVFTDRTDALAHAPRILERDRLREPGGIPLTGLLAERLFGRLADTDGLREQRYVRYDDADGAPQGLLVYTVGEVAGDLSSSTLAVRHLAAATDDGYAALWRFVLEHDLVTTARAWLRSTDEPLRWLIDDPRAIRTLGVRDHLWLRVLDPVVALEARRYVGPARILLEVDDALGYAAGRFLLDVAPDGTGRVLPDSGDEPGVPGLRLDAGALASLYLGGVAATVLARAGRVTERRPGDAAATDRVLHSAVVPRLGVWF